MKRYLHKRLAVIQASDFEPRQWALKREKGNRNPFSLKSGTSQATVRLDHLGNCDGRGEA
jgi:hypothetical protein